jgi:integrating conjugative element protein (TIGR03749 family)
MIRRVLRLALILWAVGPAIGQAAPAPALSGAEGLPPLPDPLSGRTLPAGDPPERLAWARVPLAITLPVGRERLVSFPVPVKVGLPLDLGPDRLRTQIVGGTVYWTALQAFKAQRVQVQAVDSGNIYLVDLAASQGAPALPPLEVALPETAPGAITGFVGAALPAAGPGAPAFPPPEPPKPREQDYGTLIRMAAQHLYAPARLHQVPEGVQRAPAGGDPSPRLVRGFAVDATPLAAWRSGSLYVTAVKLKNRLDEPVDLDPRRLRGQWRAAAFQHGRLAPRGDLRDTSAVYLVSTQPYPEALNGR